MTTLTREGVAELIEKFRQQNISTRHLTGKHDQSTHGRKKNWKGDLPSDLDGDLYPEMKATLTDLQTTYTVPTKINMGARDDAAFVNNDDPFGPVPNGTMAYTDLSNGEITLSPYTFGRGGNAREAIAESKRVRNVEIGEAPGDPDNIVVRGPFGVSRKPGDVLTHEYAHVLTGAYGNKDETAGIELFKSEAQIMGLDPNSGATVNESYFKKSVKENGLYGTSDPFETTAEAFVVHRQGKSTPLADLVGDTFDDAFKQPGVKPVQTELPIPGVNAFLSVEQLEKIMDTWASGGFTGWKQPWAPSNVDLVEEVDSERREATETATPRPPPTP